MVWHEILAWVIIVVAFALATAWCIQRFTCPASECDKCEKKCNKQIKQTDN